MSNDKYPRTFHLPWSDGCSSDDKKLDSVDHFLSSKENLVELIITEKLDGGNACLMSSGVYARTHTQITTHPSFNLLKSKHASMKHLIKPGEQIFGENCFAAHQIHYQLLPDVFFVFGIRYENKWLSFDEMTLRCNEIGVSTVPLLFRGSVESESKLMSLCNSHMVNPSAFGGDREGIVIRLANSFLDKDFSISVSKQVRKNHVNDGESWTTKPMMIQNIKKI